ncbi:MAG: hypothetical protein VR64_14590 [Desulfatitalea sp. BRH_c12]|nr:MAG: hypothetical protein VR64_14590 [Desulfatitalea sp. BRH_c12]
MGAGQGGVSDQLLRNIFHFQFAPCQYVVAGVEKVKRFGIKGHYFYWDPEFHLSVIFNQKIPINSAIYSLLKLAIYRWISFKVKEIGIFPQSWKKIVWSSFMGAGGITRNLYRQAMQIQYIVLFSQWHPNLVLWKVPKLCRSRSPRKKVNIYGMMMTLMKTKPFRWSKC